MTEIQSTQTELLEAFSAIHDEFDLASVARILQLSSSHGITSMASFTQFPSAATSSGAASSLSLLSLFASVGVRSVAIMDENDLDEDGDMTEEDLHRRILSAFDPRNANPAR